MAHLDISNTGRDEANAPTAQEDTDLNTPTDGNAVPFPNSDRVVRSLGETGTAGGLRREEKGPLSPTETKGQAAQTSVPRSEKALYQNRTLHLTRHSHKMKCATLPQKGVLRQPGFCSAHHLLWLSGSQESSVLVTCGTRPARQLDQQL